MLLPEKKEKENGRAMGSGVAGHIYPYLFGTTSSSATLPVT
jgi:hypothetical protein